MVRHARHLGNPPIQSETARPAERNHPTSRKNLLLLRTMGANRATHRRHTTVGQKLQRNPRHAPARHSRPVAGSHRKAQRQNRHPERTGCPPLPHLHLQPTRAAMQKGLSTDVTTHRPMLHTSVSTHQRKKP